MPFKPNYRFERNQRTQAKAARKEEKAAERAARRAAREAAEPSAGDACAPDEPLPGAAPGRSEPGE